MERPILFSAPMVRAILEGRKTQTRRVVKPDLLSVTGLQPMGWGTYETAADFPNRARCPFGKPGDQLWVRETWRPGAWRFDRVALDYRASPEVRRTPWLYPPAEQMKKLDLECREEAESALLNGDERVWEGDEGYEWEPGNGPFRWRPSIHMPRWASRLTLEVTGVRVERLQSISREDALAEGIHRVYGFWGTPEAAFAALWRSINGPDSWAANPWVWVVEFKRLSAL